MTLDPLALDDAKARVTRFYDIQAAAEKQYNAARQAAWDEDLKGVPEPPAELSQYLVCMIPARNGTGCLDLPLMMYQVAALLKRDLRFSVSASGSGPWEGRSVVCLAVGERLGVEKFRGLFLDSDIFIDKADQVADAIRVADENHWNIVAPYRQADSLKSMSVFKKPDALDGADYHIYDKDLAEMEDYAEVDSAGLGFYYGDIYTKYSFYSNAWGTEDVHFFHDNHIRPRVAKNVKLWTLKSVYI